MMGDDYFLPLALGGLGLFPAAAPASTLRTIGPLFISRDEDWFFVVGEALPAPEMLLSGVQSSLCWFVLGQLPDRQKGHILLYLFHTLK